MRARALLGIDLCIGCGVGAIVYGIVDITPCHTATCLIISGIVALVVAYTLAVLQAGADD